MTLSVTSEDPKRHHSGDVVLTAGKTLQVRIGAPIEVICEETCPAGKELHVHVDVRIIESEV